MADNRRGSPQIKICGITQVGEAFYLNEVHAEYAGFVFWQNSKRKVSFAQAEEIHKYLDKRIKRVAVTVSPNLELVRRVEQAGFDILQVHGDLQEDVLRQCGVPIWRACNLQKPQDMNGLEQDAKITGYVLDAKQAGSGKPFDWAGSRTAVEHMKATVFAGKMFVLAGGLNPKNIVEAVKTLEPDAVDVSTGVEGANGKEKSLVLDFVGKVRGS